MMSCRIFWISSIRVAKASALTSLILLGRDLAGSKLMQRLNPLFAKKGDIIVVLDMLLLPVNFARDSQLE